MWDKPWRAARSTPFCTRLWPQHSLFAALRGHR
jgi:hypothetical protein